MIWQEELSICVSKVHQVGMHLLEQPGRSVRRHGGVQTKITKYLREAVHELVNETKAVGKFKRQDGSDVGATLMTELNPKMMLEDV